MDISMDIHGYGYNCRVLMVWLWSLAFIYVGTLLSIFNSNSEKVVITKYVKICETCTMKYFTTDLFQKICEQKKFQCNGLSVIKILAAIQILQLIVEIACNL
jgi:hypothetical protein